MPKDTVREPRINLASVKDHFKYFLEGMGVGSSLAGKAGRILGAGGPSGRQRVGGAWRFGLVAAAGHCGPGEAESDPGRCLALLPEAPRRATPPADARTASDALPGFQGGLSCQKEGEGLDAWDVFIFWTVSES